MPIAYTRVSSFTGWASGVSGNERRSRKGERHNETPWPLSIGFAAEAVYVAAIGLSLAEIQSRGRPRRTRFKQLPHLAAQPWRMSDSKCSSGTRNIFSRSVSCRRRKCRAPSSASIVPCLLPLTEMQAHLRMLQVRGSSTSVTMASPIADRQVRRRSVRLTLPAGFPKRVPLGVNPFRASMLSVL